MSILPPTCVEYGSQVIEQGEMFAPLDVTVDDKDDVTTVRCRGELDMDTADMLTAVLNRVLTPAPGRSCSTWPVLTSSTRPACGSCSTAWSGLEPSVRRWSSAGRSQSSSGCYGSPGSPATWVCHPPDEVSGVRPVTAR